MREKLSKIMNTVIENDDLLADQDMAVDLFHGLHDFAVTAWQGHYNAYDLETRLDLLDVYWKGFWGRDFILRRRQQKLDRLQYFVNKVSNTALLKYLAAKSASKGKLHH